MATLKGLSRSKRSETLSKGLMVDTWRGILRVRKWPRKRGTPKSPLQLWWIDWFRQANKLAKYADGMSQARAIEITKDSGMYPRDVLLSAMRGRLYIWQDQTGKVWYPMAAVQDISESLDVLAQSIGSVLVRAADRWRAPTPGVVGDVLTLSGSPAIPAWAAAAGGGGIVAEELAGTPITCDNTVSQYDFDVTLYSEVIFSLEGIGYAASDTGRMRLSVDGGSTFKAGASDYYSLLLNKATEAAALTTLWRLGSANGTTAHNGIARIGNLQNGQASQDADLSRGAASVSRLTGQARFAGPVTDIRIFSNGANNFNAGVIRAVGLRKA